jgi:hypothetical protein
LYTCYDANNRSCSDHASGPWCGGRRLMRNLLTSRQLVFCPTSSSPVSKLGVLVCSWRLVLPLRFQAFSRPRTGLCPGCIRPCSSWRSPGSAPGPIHRRRVTARVMAHPMSSTATQTPLPVHRPGRVRRTRSLPALVKDRPTLVSVSVRKAKKNLIL